MRRFVFLWALLGVAHFAAREAVAVGLFRHVDLRYVAFAQIVVVPAVQAAVLAAVSRRRAGRPMSARVVNLARRPLLVALLAAAGAVLALAWSFRSRPLFALGSTRSLPAAAVAAFSLAAAAALLSARSRLREGRVALLLLASGLALWAADALTGFLTRVPDVLLPRISQLARLVAVFGGMLALAVGLLLGAASVARSRRSPSALLFDAATGLTLLSSTIVVLSFFNRPWIDEPWLTIMRSGSFLALTAVLLGSVALAGDARAAA